MNLDELRPILHAYRAQVERAWSPATAHPGYDGRAGDPAGQCGVTSAWLQRRLWEDHGIEAWYCVGTAWVADEANRNHCWLEIGEGVDRIIVDLTADQLAGFKRWICTRLPDLWISGISYIYRRRFAAEELLADPVRPRLDILTEALS